MRQFKFKAVISLDPAAQLPATQYPAEIHSVMVRASRPGLPGSGRYFPAVIVRDDVQALRPGDSQVIVTISVPDDEGFEFFLARRIRPGTPGLDEDPTPERLRRRRREPEDFPVSVQFSDGRTAISGRPRGDFEPTGPILPSRGGGGTSHSQLFRWWVWPLPPAGPLEFICQWPVYGIGETRIGIDGQLILDAARRSVQLWPEDDPDAAT